MVIYMHLLLCYYGDCFHGNSCFDNTHVAMVTHMLILFVWIIWFHGFVDITCPKSYRLCMQSKS